MNFFPDFVGRTLHTLKVYTLNCEIVLKPLLVA